MAADAERPSWAATLAAGAIRAYQRWLSPCLPPLCRFQPTCSQYALEAIQRYGFMKGCWLGTRRLLRCNPLFPGGHDPVP